MKKYISIIPILLIAACATKDNVEPNVGGVCENKSSCKIRPIKEVEKLEYKNDAYGEVIPNSVVVVENKCADGMVLVDGEFCTKIITHCKEWLDPQSSYRRCNHFDKSTCEGPKVHTSYCMDKEEMHDDTGMPLKNKSWTQCKQLCEEQNKRLCKIDEFKFACSGPDMLPYPWGYDFSNTICNMERRPLVCGKNLCDHIENISEKKSCVSPFGIHNMIGNTEMWVEAPRYNHSQVPGMTMRSVLMGGHTGGGRHFCFGVTYDHSESFHQLIDGCQCCSDVK